MGSDVNEAQIGRTRSQAFNMRHGTNAVFGFDHVTGGTPAILLLLFVSQMNAKCKNTVT
jgi:hypothetical protein